MSRMGKACWLLAILFLGATGVARLVINSFHESLYVSLGLGLIFLIIAFVKDFKTYREFFGMRTTKNGLAMGWLIVLGFIVFACVNFLAVRYNKSWDWSTEGFNSLSEQSVKIVSDLKSEAKIILLIRGTDAPEDEIKKTLQELVRLFQTKSKNLKLEIYNALARPDLAQKYQFKSGSFGLYLEYEGKNLKIDSPTEEAVTKTLLKLTREKKKVIYLIQGHKERAIEGETPETISEFKAELETTYIVKPLTLFQEGNKVPEDAAMVAVIGPGQELLPTEFEALKAYAERGGHFLIAADPGEKHNIAHLTKIFGIEFQNNYVLDPRATVPGAGNVAALGSMYSSESEITKSMGSNMSLFLIASELKKAPDAPPTFAFDEIVKTNEASISTNELAEKAKMTGRGPHALGISVVGKLSADKEFTAVFFGDSDIFSNQLFLKYGNRDLTLNSVAALAKDEDLISIRPKQPKGTVIEAAHMPAIRIFMLIMLALPVVFLISSGVIWFKRRSA